MYLIELNRLIEDGENKTVEFKRKFSTPEKIAKEMVAFANTKGGMIFFGIDDDRTIIGVQSEKEELELIDTSARFYCEPEIEYETEIACIRNKDIVIVTVLESKSKPIRLISENSDEKRVYIRINDKSVIASKETISILKNSSPDAHPLHLNFGDIEKSLLKYLQENERITVKEFKKLVNISERRASRILVNLVKAEIIRHHLDNSFEFFTIA